MGAACGIVVGLVVLRRGRMVRAGLRLRRWSRFRLIQGRSGLWPLLFSCSDYGWFGVVVSHPIANCG
jgi:hypothetical protein